MAEAAKTYADLVSLIEKSEKEYDLALIEKAYQFAEAAHQGQVRRSGEPYIIHPIAVAYKLVEFGMDTPSNVKHWAVRNCRSLLSCIKIKQLNNSWIFLRVLIS